MKIDFTQGRSTDHANQVVHTVAAAKRAPAFLKSLRTDRLRACASRAVPKMASNGRVNGPKAEFGTSLLLIIDLPCHLRPQSADCRREHRRSGSFEDCGNDTSRFVREQKLTASDQPFGWCVPHRINFHVSAPVTNLQRLRSVAFISQGGRCYYCNEPMWYADPQQFARRYHVSEKQVALLRLTAEHLLARSEGGRDLPENIVAACAYCNGARHRAVEPLAPSVYRKKVRRRMAAGKWHGLRLHGHP